MRRPFQRLGRQPGDQSSALTPVRAVALIFAASGLLMGTWASRLPAVKQAADLSPGRLGLVLLVMSVGSISASALCPRLLRRSGSGLAIRIGCLLGVLGLLVLALGSAQPWVITGLVLIGLGGGVWDVAMNVAAGPLDRQHRRAVMYRFHGAFSVGTVAGASFGALFAGLGLPLAAHLLTVGAVLVVLIGWWTTLLPPDAADRGPQPGSHALSPWRTIALGLIVAGAAFAEGSANDWLAVAGVEGYRLSESMAALGLAMFVGAMTLTRFGMSTLTRRWLRGHRVLLVGTLLVCTGSVLVCLGGHLLVGGAGVGLWIGSAGAICWGIGIAPAFPLAMRAAARATHAPATTVGCVSAIGYSAFLAGPPAVGAVADRVGILQAVLVVPLVLALAFCVAGAHHAQAWLRRRVGVGSADQLVAAQPPADLAAQRGLEPVRSAARLD